MTFSEYKSDCNEYYNSVVSEDVIVITKFWTFLFDFVEVVCPWCWSIVCFLDLFIKQSSPPPPEMFKRAQKVTQYQLPLKIIKTELKHYFPDFFQA